MLFHVAMALATCVATTPEKRRRLRVDGPAHWLDLARAQPPAGHHRIFIERAYGVLARLPRPLLVALAGFGHRVMEARHLRGIQRRSTEPGGTLTDTLHLVWTMITTVLLRAPKSGNGETSGPEERKDAT